jgi:acyl-CoA synthetase (NDP forming)
MSVHGEFSRTLERLIDCVGMLDGEESAAMRRTLEEARISVQPDLESAARAALSAVAALEAFRVSTSAPESALLEEAQEHLQAHCGAILGG